MRKFRLRLLFAAAVPAALAAGLSLGTAQAVPAPVHHKVLIGGDARRNHPDPWSSKLVQSFANGGAGDCLAANGTIGDEVNTQACSSMDGNQKVDGNATTSCNNGFVSMTCPNFGGDLNADWLGSPLITMDRSNSSSDFFAGQNSTTDVLQQNGGSNWVVVDAADDDSDASCTDPTNGCALVPVEATQDLGGDNFWVLTDEGALKDANLEKNPNFLTCGKCVWLAS